MLKKKRKDAAGKYIYILLTFKLHLEAHIWLVTCKHGKI